MAEGYVVAADESYGLRLRLENGEVLTIADMDPDELVVLEFLNRLIGEQLDGDQLHYLAEDWVNNVHGMRGNTIKEDQ